MGDFEVEFEEEQEENEIAQGKFGKIKQKYILIIAGVISGLIIASVIVVASTSSSPPTNTDEEGNPRTPPKQDSPFRESSKEKPNILLILADDLGAGDIPFYFNSSLVAMPNLQKLADKGLRFTNAHATPLCAPSRYSLLSGNYPHRGEEKSGTWFFNDDHGNQFRGNQKSIAELLQQHGYHTSIAGKWHLGGKVPLVSPGKSNLTYIITDDNHDWSQAFIQGPHEIGFDKSLITAAGIQHPPFAFFRNGYLDSPREETVYWEADSEHDMPFGTSIIGKDGGEGKNDWDSTAYNMIIANETIAFIDKHLDERPEDPFFVYAALGAVHIPHSPPDYASDGTKIKGSYPSSHLDMVHEVDKIVGTLIDSIEERMLSRDTIIIFTSDNGGLGKSKKFGHNASGPLRGYKGQVYEGGTRVPLLVQWDGEFPAGEVIEGLVGINDLYATIADITNVSIPNESAEDSISFKSYLELSAEEEIRKFMPTWKYTYNKPQHSLRSKDYKLIHKPYEDTIEFYDLKNDIGETMDLSDIILHGDVMTEMYEELVRLGPCARDENGFVDTRYRNICNSQLNFHSATDFP